MSASLRLISSVGLASLLIIVSASSVFQPFVGHAGTGTLSNVPIVGEAAPDRQQVEPTIAVDPRNPSIIVAGAQDLRLRSTGGHRWHGYYRSTDGGQTWSSALLPGFPGDTSLLGVSSPLHRSNTTSDPVMAFDNHGVLYYAGLVFNITSGGVGNTVLFVARYVDDGAVYDGATLITGPLFADKEWIAVDNTGGPFDGNLYVAFDANLTATLPFATMLTRSTDGGRTFSTPFYAPTDKTGELPGITVDSNGNVYICSDAFDPVTGVPLDYVQVTKITDGGATIVQNVKAVNPAFFEQSIPGGQFRAFTIPQIAADKTNVYLVWDDLREGNVSVFITGSTDGGLVWSDPHVVNDMPQGQHFFPTIAARGGVVGVAWYDSRSNVGSSITSLDVFYAESQNGGLTFSPNMRLTSVSFNPELVERSDGPNYFEPFIGDYFGISMSATSAHIIWVDNRNACDTRDPVYGCVDQDVYTVAVPVLPATPSHDVGVYGLSVAASLGYAGISAIPVLASLTTTNLGSTQESFSLVFKANSTVIATANVVLLAGYSQNVSVSWSVGGLARGVYNVTAAASTVNGEAVVWNNVALDPVLFVVRLGGDVNGDCRVNILDLARVAFAYGSSIGPSPIGSWNAIMDLNNDGSVDQADLLLFSPVFGQSC